VIPEGIRESMRIAEGDVFAVAYTRDSVVLKRVNIPSKKQIFEDLKTMTAEITEDLKKRGITEEDIIRGALKRR